MTSVTAINKIEGRSADTSVTLTRQNLRRWTVASFASAALGGLSGIAGFVIGLLTVGGLTVPSTTLYTIGTVLIGASFILFGLAAHCLDKLDIADGAIRLEYCRQNGLEDEERAANENTK